MASVVENSYVISLVVTDEQHYLTVPAGGGCSLIKRIYGERFVIHDFEYCVQLCNLQQVMNLIRQFEQFQFAALFSHTGKGTDQIPET